MKPIIFSTPMVQAILDGRKTMTRRVVKLPAYVKQSDMDDTYTLTEEGGGYSRGWSIPDMISNNYIKRPYYKRDVLWVREAWTRLIDVKGDLEYFYRADMENPTGCHKTAWHPSIHMPREAARLFLRVTSVRAERVQDISEDDAKREGVCGLCYDAKTGEERYSMTYFKVLWDSLNAKRGYGWDSNPFVWVISFERLE